MNIREHLLVRRCPLELEGIMISEEENVCTFWLYNLFGQIVGYQRYNPLGIKNYNPKDEVSKYNQKYWTYLSDYYFKDKACLWGWQFYDSEVKNVYLVEGIFDALALIDLGYVNVFATLGNEPKVLKNQIRLLGDVHTIIVFNDGDSAGKKLRKYGDYSFEVTGGKDCGDLSKDDLGTFVRNCLGSI